MCKFLCMEMVSLTFPIRNETTSHPIRVIFRHIGKTRKPPCRERVAFFLLFPSIYSFAEEACAHIIYIYIPTAITMAAISVFILSVLWGATAILSPVLCQLHCRPSQKTACSCCCYLYLAYFCPKVINCYSCMCHVCRHYGQL